MFTDFKNSFTGKMNDKSVMESPINLNAWLCYIINHNTYFRLLPVFWHSISEGSVATYLRCGGIFKYQGVCQWKNLENRLTFAEVMGKRLVSCFSDSQCIECIVSILCIKKISIYKVQINWDQPIKGPHKTQGYLSVNYILQLKRPLKYICISRET